MLQNMLVFLKPMETLKKKFFDKAVNLDELGIDPLKEEKPEEEKKKEEKPVEGTETKVQE